MAHRAHIFGGEVTRYPKDVPVKPVDSVTLFHLPGWTSPSFHRRRPAAAAFCCTKEINDDLDVHGCSRAVRPTDRLTTRTVAGRVAVVGAAALEVPCASHSQGETALVALVPISSSGRTRSQPSKLGEGANGGLQRCRLDSLQ